MNYLNSSFSVGQPSSTDGVSCEACVYGTSRGERHTCATGVVARFLELRAKHTEEAIRASR